MKLPKFSETRVIRARRGFTLIELLVVIAIIGILAGLLLPCLAKAKMRARAIEEMSAGRQLMYAVQMYGDDFSGKMFPGYAEDRSAVDDQKKPLGSPANQRYPWRIAPYVSGSLDLIYSGENRARLTKLRTQDRHNYAYEVSLYPSLGINSYFMGGHDGEFSASSMNTVFGQGTVVTHMTGMKRPSDLIVFASASSSLEGGEAQGYFRVKPPYMGARTWAPEYSPTALPEHWGFVAPRFNKRAVVAMADGHSQMLDMEGLQDMRHWNDRADRADWTLQLP